MRGVLCLFEGVATGAADGYGRMPAGPAATLLHLGPGLGNGLANLHNARRGLTPLLAVVGDHATTHKQFDRRWNRHRRPGRHGVGLGPAAAAQREVAAGRGQRPSPRRWHRAAGSPPSSCRPGRVLVRGRRASARAAGPGAAARAR
jgi:hypothetical protein